MKACLDDFQNSSLCPASVLRYEKGDWWLMDYAPVWGGSPISEKL
jgi:hypothetical protein